MNSDFEAKCEKHGGTLIESYSSTAKGTGHAWLFTFSELESLISDIRQEDAARIAMLVEPICAAINALHSALCAGGDYGDDINDHYLRKKINDARESLLKQLGFSGDDAMYQYAQRKEFTLSDTSAQVTAYRESERKRNRNEFAEEMAARLRYESLNTSADIVIAMKEE